MRKRWWLQAALLISFLGIWQIAVRELQISSLVLPAPTEVATSIWTSLRTGYLWPHIVITLEEVLLGFAFAVVVGVGVGVWMAESAAIRSILTPYIIASQAVPKLALAPLFILWFGFGMTSKVVITALICFFPLLEATVTGIEQIDSQKLDLFRIMRANRWQTMLYLKIPHAWPSIVSGMRVAVILAVVGAVVGEFVGASKGLGAMIIASQSMMDTPLMFTIIFLLTLMGYLLYMGVDLLSRLYQPKK